MKPNPILKRKNNWWIYFNNGIYYLMVNDYELGVIYLKENAELMSKELNIPIENE